MLAYLLREEYKRGKGALGWVLEDLYSDAVLADVVEQVGHLVVIKGVLKVARRHADQTVVVVWHGHYLLRAAHLCHVCIVTCNVGSFAPV